MAGRHFRRMLEAQWDAGRFLCVGLDSDLEKIPSSARKGDVRETILDFNRAIIGATKDLVCAYKPNSAFYEAYGDAGWLALRDTLRYIADEAPEVPVILDSKRADIGNTNRGYARSFFDYLGADAITVPPFVGREAIQVFLDREDKGVFILCRTSNPGASEFQDLNVGGRPLYEVIAEHVADSWNEHGNGGLVAGATYPEELKKIRHAAPHVPILLPGIGAQNGDLQTSVRFGKDSRGRGLVVAASRAVIFAGAGDDFAAAARRKAQELHGEIQRALIQ